jgi:hypothetical protein
VSHRAHSSGRDRHSGKRRNVGAMTCLYAGFRRYDRDSFPLTRNFIVCILVCITDWSAYEKHIITPSRP